MDGPATLTIVASSRSIVFAASTTAATIQRRQYGATGGEATAMVVVGSMMWLQT